jgi:hypothetical protein
MPSRPYCLPGLRSAYGLRFARFLSFGTESERVTALKDGVVNAAVLFTTDGNLADGSLVLLADNRHLQPAENVVPVITQQALARYGRRLTTAVNAVSAQLSSAELLFLNWRIEVAGHGELAEARPGWNAIHPPLARLIAVGRSSPVLAGCSSPVRLPRRLLQPHRRGANVAPGEELLEDPAHPSSFGAAETGRRQVGQAEPEVAARFHQAARNGPADPLGAGGQAEVDVR